MRAISVRCQHCGSAHEVTLIVPQSTNDPIQKAERMALCPRCDAPSSPPPRTYRDPEAIA